MLFLLLRCFSQETKGGSILWIIQVVPKWNGCVGGERWNAFVFGKLVVVVLFLLYTFFSSFNGKSNGFLDALFFSWKWRTNFESYFPPKATTTTTV